MSTVTNITTLNQLVGNLRDIADLHQQIHGFNYGEPWEFYQSGVTNSPEMWVTCEGVTREGSKVSTYNMRVYIVDNVKRGELNELEVESDLIQIAEDVIAQLRHPSYGWNLPDDASLNISVRTERTPKMLTAAEFAFSVRVKKPDNRCAIPFSSPPIFNEGGSTTSCASATVVNSDSSYSATVASGGTLTLPDTTYNVYVGNVLNATQTVPTLKNETINIVWQ